MFKNLVHTLCIPWDPSLPESGSDPEEEDEAQSRFPDQDLTNRSISPPQMIEVQPGKGFTLASMTPTVLRKKFAEVLPVHSL